MNLDPQHFDFTVPDSAEVNHKYIDLLAESLGILYSQLETQIVTQRLNPENLAIETWTECDETSFRVCARFVSKDGRWPSRPITRKPAGVDTGLRFPDHPVGNHGDLL